MNFLKAGMMARRYDLPFEYDVQVVDSYHTLACRMTSGYTVYATVITDGVQRLVRHWMTNMTHNQAVALAEKVKSATQFDAGRWCLC